MNEPAVSNRANGGRDLSRPIAIAFFGPAIGSAVMLLVMIILALPFDEPDMLDMLWRVAVFVLVIGYMAGIVPSVLSALFWHFGISRLGSAVMRIAASIATGALAGSIIVWPAIELMFGTYAPDSHFYAYTAFAGAVALLATARPWRPQP